MFVKIKSLEEIKRIYPEGIQGIWEEEFEKFIPKNRVIEVMIEVMKVTYSADEISHLKWIKEGWWIEESIIDENYTKSKILERNLKRK